MFIQKLNKEDIIRFVSTGFVGQIVDFSQNAESVFVKIGKSDSEYSVVKLNDFGVLYDSNATMYDARTLNKIYNNFMCQRFGISYENAYKEHLKQSSLNKAKNSAGINKNAGRDM